MTSPSISVLVSPADAATDAALKTLLARFPRGGTFSRGAAAVAASPVAFPLTLSFPCGSSLLCTSPRVLPDHRCGIIARHNVLDAPDGGRMTTMDAPVLYEVSVALPRSEEAAGEELNLSAGRGVSTAAPSTRASVPLRSLEALESLMRVTEEVEQFVGGSSSATTVMAKAVDEDYDYFFLQ